MKLAWATDIHLDFCSPQVRERFYGQVRGAAPDALLITGDIADARSLERLLLELAEAVDMPVYFVLGNHDFYGSTVCDVRDRARELGVRDERLHWLPVAGIVPLGAGSVLVGHDGWADGRFGDWWRSSVVLNDYLHIRDLAPANLVRSDLLGRIQALAAEAAEYFREILPRALGEHDRVVVATHVPPFREACWHEGRISGDEWLPHFSSKIVGEVLLEAAGAHPRTEVTVVCGHTHGEGTAQMLPNLVVRTGGAAYGKPGLQAVLEA
jgi:3',5'-cyclic AMP phosphodiesterase CpdA